MTTRRRPRLAATERSSGGRVSHPIPMRHCRSLQPARATPEPVPVRHASFHAPLGRPPWQPNTSKPIASWTFASALSPLTHMNSLMASDLGKPLMLLSGKHTRTAWKRCAWSWLSSRPALRAGRGRLKTGRATCCRMPASRTYLTRDVSTATDLVRISAARLSPTTSCFVQLVRMCPDPVH